MSAAGTAVFTGGGTGGHLYPAIAVARELSAHGLRVLFVGSRLGREAEILRAEGLEFRGLKVYGLVGKGLAARLKALAFLPLALLAAVLLLLAERPRFVFGTGGYAAGPVMLAALLLGRPTALHESNRVPGLTNRLLGRFASLSLSQFPEAARELGGRAVAVGTPVRADFFAIQQPAPGPRLRLLVVGGSSGAASLDRLWIDALQRLAAGADRLEIVHQCSTFELERVREFYARGGWSAQAESYYFDLPNRMAWCDLVVCRAGAGTLAELAAAGRGAILVPLPAAAHDHQRHNALAVQAAGAAVVIEQGHQAPARLAAELTRHLESRGPALDMGRQARALARPEAAREIARLLMEL
jgi:UDP-N-acetylglucosamine--N-acetylmuramyl-(pentapeptide) pyrophosphoryl-undecaprenol N-acetylglucosamine transferase